MKRLKFRARGHVLPANLQETAYSPLPLSSRRGPEEERTADGVTPVLVRVMKHSCMTLAPRFQGNKRKKRLLPVIGIVTLFSPSGALLHGVVLLGVDLDGGKELVCGVEVSGALVV